MTRYVFLVLLLSTVTFVSAEEGTVKCDNSSIEESVPSTEEVDTLKGLVQAQSYCSSYFKCFKLELEEGVEELFLKDEKTCVNYFAKEKEQCSGLSEVERHSVSKYTGSGYGSVNESIWRDDTAACEGVIKAIEQGLDVVPDYKGWVFRGADLPLSIREEHQEGRVVTYKAFTSTSTNYGWAGRDQFMIYSKTGSSIDDISYNKGENEVLFNTATQFKVIKTFYNDIADVRLYIMVEVDPSVDLKESLAKEKDLLDNISNTVKQLTEMSSLYLPLHKNIFNDTQFISEEHWLCSEGVNGSDIFPTIDPKNSSLELNTVGLMENLEIQLKSIQAEVEYLKKELDGEKLSKEEIADYKESLESMSADEKEFVDIIRKVKVKLENKQL